MDKKAVNNEIVRMRPIANKAKISIISKLTREVKSLRVPKDYHSEAQKQKNSNKIERLVAELLLMKKLKHDDISKFALTHSREEITAIKSKPNSSLKARSLCRLALHGGLAAHVNQFRSLFPKWESSLISLIESIGVKEKRKTVIAKHIAAIRTKTVNLEKEIQKRSSDSDELITKVGVEDEKLGIDSDEANATENFKSDNLPIERRDNDTDANDEQEPSSMLLKSVGHGNNNAKKHLDILKLKQPTIKVKTKTKNSKSKLTKVVTISRNKPLKCVPTSTTESSPLQTCPSSSAAHISKVKAKKEAKPKITKKHANMDDHQVSKIDSKGTAINRNKIMKVIRFTELAESTEKSDTFFESISEETPNVGPKTVDSFFVTEGGKSEFFSSVPVKETVEETTHARYTPQEMYDSSGRRLNRREIRARLRGGYSNEKFPSKSFTPKDRGNQRPYTEVRLAPKRNNTHTSQPKTIVQPADEILHPSWEAKKKQKEQLNIGFQGKKIKFDD